MAVGKFSKIASLSTATERPINEPSLPVGSAESWLESMLGTQASGEQVNPYDLKGSFDGAMAALWQESRQDSSSPDPTLSLAESEQAGIAVEQPALPNPFISLGLLLKAPSRKAVENMAIDMISPTAKPSAPIPTGSVLGTKDRTQVNTPGVTRPGSPVGKSSEPIENRQSNGNSIDFNLESLASNQRCQLQHSATKPTRASGERVFVDTTSKQGSRTQPSRQSLGHGVNPLTESQGSSQGALVGKSGNSQLDRGVIGLPTKSNPQVRNDDSRPLMMMEQLAGDGGQRKDMERTAGIGEPVTLISRVDANQGPLSTEPVRPAVTEERSVPLSSAKLDQLVSSAIHQLPKQGESKRLHLMLNGEGLDGTRITIERGDMGLQVQLIPGAQTSSRWISDHLGQLQERLRAQVTEPFEIAIKAGGDPSNSGDGRSSQHWRTTEWFEVLDGQE